jgi:hypothetical protein
MTVLALQLTSITTSTSTHAKAQRIKPLMPSRQTTLCLHRQRKLLAMAMYPMRKASIILIKIHPTSIIASVAAHSGPSFAHQRNLWSQLSFRTQPSTKMRQTLKVQHRLIGDIYPISKRGSILTRRLRNLIRIQISWALTFSLLQLHTNKFDLSSLQVVDSQYFCSSS